MNLAINIFAVFGALIFFGLLVLIIKDMISERYRKRNIQTYLSAAERAEYLQHDEEMNRIYSLAINRKNRTVLEDRK